ncbi:hypothetical protein CEE69_17800 [Rhodopirellula bahusiensis]|uniref:Uncharacterized protein n=1 Tax=Rhodopirellula bahusiensis TaxID=2014065 RepID=A0A2G1W573_9BACT|nr:hypothetical protein CEE69_17800 [Rhodopirellula bahusiensis]
MNLPTNSRKGAVFRDSSSFRERVAPAWALDEKTHRPSVWADIRRWRLATFANCENGGLCSNEGLAVKSHELSCQLSFAAFCFSTLVPDFV